METDDLVVADKQFEKILAVVEKQDRDALKGMFSVKAQTNSKSFDEDIASLFDYFKGDILSYDDHGCGKVFIGKNDEGYKRQWKTTETTYNVETSEGFYQFAIKTYVTDTATSDNIGIESLYVIRLDGAEKEDKEIAYWGDGDWTYGINFDKIYVEP